MPVFKKEEIRGITDETGLVICSDCFDDDEVTSSDRVITDKDCEDQYYFCDKCKARL